MIVFKTMSQVKSYIKRHKGFSYYEGCGCCWQEQSYIFDKDKNRVLLCTSGEYRGEYEYRTKIIGKLRRKE